MPQRHSKPPGGVSDKTSFQRSCKTPVTARNKNKQCGRTQKPAKSGLTKSTSTVQAGTLSRDETDTEDNTEDDDDDDGDNSTEKDIVQVEFEFQPILETDWQAAKAFFSVSYPFISPEDVSTVSESIVASPYGTAVHCGGATDNAIALHTLVPVSGPAFDGAESSLRAGGTVLRNMILKYAVEKSGGSQLRELFSSQQGQGVSTWLLISERLYNAPWVLGVSLLGILNDELCSTSGQQASAPPNAPAANVDYILTLCPYNLESNYGSDRKAGSRVKVSSENKIRVYEKSEDESIVKLSSLSFDFNPPESKIKIAGCVLKVKDVPSLLCSLQQQAATSPYCL